MKSKSKIIINMIACLLLFGGIFAYLNGWIKTSPTYTHPSCDQLPTAGEATDALNNHKSLVKEIEEISDGITMKVGRPCPDDKDRGLILVNYHSKSERESINSLLTHSEGFGVPVYLEKH